MRRRDFVILLAGAMGGWPSAVRAQQKPMPVIGYLSPGSPESDAFRLTAFRQGLNETGYVEGQNVAIEYRWAEGQYDRLPALAADQVRRQVAVITAAGIPPTFAAKAATSTIPIVFLAGVELRQWPSLIVMKLETGVRLSLLQAHHRETTMEHYAGIDVSLESASLCVVDATGRIVREAKVASEPDVLIGWFGGLEFNPPQGQAAPDTLESFNRQRVGRGRGGQGLCRRAIQKRGCLIPGPH
jgi:hypothetical protein